ncbi:MAG: amidohydrolase [Tannerella sp.]|nr:amidohydrolase [Tannerella sp.]
MSSILIKSVELNGRPVDILVEENRIARISPRIEREAATVVDGSRKAVIPGLMNLHTHAGMTLFRGYGDDMPLMTWLHEKIWPNEAKLTFEDIYWGTKLACVEMLKSGTTTFLDMYHNPDAGAAAIEEMGMRAFISEVCFDHFKPELSARSRRHIEKRFASPPAYARIRVGIGPHAIYTVSGDLLRWVHDFARANGLLVQLHLAETEGEVTDCRERFDTTPVRYLRRLGVLSPHLVLSHVLHVDDDEVAMIADSGASVVHNPASNMKLASGYRFKYGEMRAAGIRVGLGTDGCSSSNNLDMIEAMKLASLLGKAWRGDPEALSCEEMLYAATEAGAAVTGLQAGRIAEGYLADLCLIDLDMPVFKPNFNFVSNLVFAANGSCVDTVICDGKIVMRGRRVPGEEEILTQAERMAYQLIAR